MTWVQQEIEYFGGPSDGHVTSFSALTAGLEITHPTQPNKELSDLQLTVTGGHYIPEQMPNGVWRLHFFDTVKR